MIQDHDWRLVPLAVACWIGAWLGTSGMDTQILVIAGALILAIIMWPTWPIWLRMAGLVLVVVTLMSGARSWQLHNGLVADLAADEAVATVHLRLEGEATVVQRAGRSWVIARAQTTKVFSEESRVAQRVPITVIASGDVGQRLADISPGAEHEAVGTLAPSEPGAPEAAVLRLRQLSVEISPPDSLNALVTSIHSGLRAATAHSPPEQAALVPSLVVGDRSEITAEIREEFRATALSHLMAVSGSNLTLMLGALLMAVKAVGVRGWWVRGVAVFGVALFVVVCRAEPSVLRAAAMGVVALSAIGLGQDRRSLRHLSLAVLVLIPLDPYLARSWGFALSAAACAGITLFAPPWITAMENWAPRWVAEAIAVPLAAQLATTPLTAMMAGQISIVGVIANALVGPFVGPATVLGLVAALSCALPPIATAAAWCAGWCVQPILWVAHWAAAAPQATLPTPAGPASVMVGALIASVGCAVAGWALARRWAAAGMAVLLLAVAWLRITPLGWPGPWQVIFCDVGQGDATLLRVGQHSAVLIDTGPEPEATLDCIQAAGVTQLVGLVLTHYHEDHVGGAEAVITRYRPPLLVVSPLASPAHAAQRIQDLAQEFGTQIIVAETGQRLEVGNLSWTTISAWQPDYVGASQEGESTTENDSSVVAVAHLDGLAVLLPGDVEPAGQQRALMAARKAGLSLRADILKLPHHGSSRQDSTFFAATGARIAVVSAGADNPYGHPGDAALDLAAAHSMTVIRTDTQGHLALGRTASGLQIRNWYG